MRARSCTVAIQQPSRQRTIQFRSGCSGGHFAGWGDAAEAWLGLCHGCVEQPRARLAEGGEGGQCGQDVLGHSGLDRQEQNVRADIGGGHHGDAEQSDCAVRANGDG